MIEIKKRETQMNHAFIMMVTGAKDPNTTKQLADTTAAAGGYWLRSHVSEIEGFFAAIFKITIDPNCEAELKSSLGAQFPQLAFHYAEVKAQAVTDLKSISLEFLCPDRPGLHQEIDDLTREMGFDVERWQARRYEVIEIGSTVFSGNMEMRVPSDVDVDGIIAKIEAVSEGMRVSFQNE